MDLPRWLQTFLGRLPKGVLAAAERSLRALPGVRASIEKEYATLLAGMEESAKPYRKEFASAARLPETGRDRTEILKELETLKAREQARWRDGFVSGGVYHGDEGFIEFLARAYALHSQS